MSFKLFQVEYLCCGQSLGYAVLKLNPCSPETESLQDFDRFWHWNSFDFHILNLRQITVLQVEEAVTLML